MSKGELAGARWFTASRSNGQGECVEVAFLDSGNVALRDTKDNGEGPVHVFRRDGWMAFVSGAKAGRFPQA